VKYKENKKYTSKDEAAAAAADDDDDDEDDAQLCAVLKGTLHIEYTVRWSLQQFRQPFIQYVQDLQRLCKFEPIKQYRSYLLNIHDRHRGSHVATAARRIRISACVYEQ